MMATQTMERYYEYHTADWYDETPDSYNIDWWEDIYDRGRYEVSSEYVEISVLMPNGIMINLETSQYASLFDIKMDVWNKASDPNNNYPLMHLIMDPPLYIFSYVSSMGQLQDLRDESLRLCDVKPFFKVLKLIWKGEEDSEKELNCQISNLLGRGIHEFAALNNQEVNEFRTKMRLVGEEVASQRRKQTPLQRLAYHFPPRLAPSAEVPKYCAARVKEKEGHFVLSARVEGLESVWKFNISYYQTPVHLTAMIQAKKSLTYQGSKSIPSEGYVLKVCGRDEYLVESVPLIQFLYIQECLSRDVEPALVLCSIASISLPDSDSIYSSVSDLDPRKKQSYNSSTPTMRKNKTVSSWSVDEDFSFTVNKIFQLDTESDDNEDKVFEVGVLAGLYHGGKPLCEDALTRAHVAQNGTVHMDEQMRLNIQLCNIPRMARLCIAVYEVSKYAKVSRARKIKQDQRELFMNPLTWVNTTVYDFRAQLKTGQHTFSMWKYCPENNEKMPSDDVLQVLNTVMANSTLDHSGDEARKAYLYRPSITISFKRYHQDASLVYPTLHKMLQYAEDYSMEMSLTDSSTSEVHECLEKIRIKYERDPMHDLFEQEKKDLWAARYHVQKHVPSLLSKLLESVEWCDHKQVAEVNSLVANWPLLKVEHALELLDYAYAEQQVRSFAVKCLKQISDEQLSLYLLQLVQAIKHENYLFCDLVEFVLKRALNNRKIGHFLFWYLRSELSYPPVAVRFRLILEAYCRGCLEHIGVLTKQLECMRKMVDMSEKLRAKDLRRDREKAKKFLRDHYKDEHNAAAMADVVNPLDPRYRLKGLRVEKCRVMDSKMRPIWLVMQNSDPLGDDVYIIFKNGDDLRQDMLALQMIRIMDMLWKKEGLDLRMSPYGCVSTDMRTGLIEVVLNAETIANIQKEKGMFTATSAFNKGSILAWLKDHNPDEGQLSKAIEEFSLSCAGYCVATYVLGVADRHSDNIMIKRSGQLFHIDYGHILGHFKEKFGFKRERVPFVLTHDFVHVINKGRKPRRADIENEFQLFQKNCETAFRILRRHGSLILSLFAMMICTGLPELSNEADLAYLRDTLVLDMTEEDAVEHFRTKFTDALANSWKTSLNWASHNLAKNNKI